MFHAANEEHLGSFLFRKRIVEGKKPDFDFRNDLLVNDKSWRLVPRYIYDLLEGDVKTYLERNTLSPLFRPTGSPFYHCEDERKTKIDPEFVFRHHDDFRSINSGYCIHCFQEQVSIHGFAWFKREWLIYSSDICVKHNVYLSTAPCSACSSSYSLFGLVKTVLEGACAKCASTNFYEEPKPAFKVSKFISWCMEILHDNLPYFSIRLKKQLFMEAFRRSNETSNFHAELHYDLVMEKLFQCSPLHTSIIRRAVRDLERPEYLQIEDTPFLIFWHVMINAFSTYNEFKGYLHEITQVKYLEGDAHEENVPYMDIRD